MIGRHENSSHGPLPKSHTDWELGKTDEIAYEKMQNFFNRTVNFIKSCDFRNRTQCNQSINNIIAILAQKTWISLHHMMFESFLQWFCWRPWTNVIINWIKKYINETTNNEYHLKQKKLKINIVYIYLVIKKYDNFISGKMFTSF